MVGRSGVYAIRVGGVVHYVGESHTDRVWKTMLRHTHAQDSFEKIAKREYVFRGNRSDLEVQFWEATPEGAIDLEAEMVRRLKPLYQEVSKYEQDEEAPF
jgi:hypothetical protein